VSEDELIPRIGVKTSVFLAPFVSINCYSGGVTVDMYRMTFTNTMNYLYDNYYKTLFDALRTPKILRVWMKFTALEFYQIDMLRPVWIEGLNGYYYINRINQWKLNTLCQVELIRINRLI
jgi:hypothetical protein